VLVHESHLVRRLGVGFSCPRRLSCAEKRTMDPHKTTLERAFDLARSGECSNVDEIRRRLKVEGYDEHAIKGRSLLMQLRALMAASKHQ
jgi:hypothetical protein